jgi:hypothetical protein
MTCSAKQSGDTMPSLLNKLKDSFVELAKNKLDDLNSVKSKKRSSFSIEDIATAGVNGNTDVVSGLGSTLGTGAELFTNLFNVFNDQFVGKFLNIIQEQMKSQQLLQQLQQNGLVSKREKLDSSDLDSLKTKFDLKLEEAFKSSDKLKGIGTDALDKYLDLAKNFTGKLKDITVDLINSVKPTENA